MLLKNMLKEMHVDESHIKPSIIMVRSHDGLPRQIIGILEVELYMGP